MSVLYVVLPLVLLLVLAAVAAYLWAARRGQFDDLETPALRALHDDEPGSPHPATGSSSPPADGSVKPEERPAPRDRA